MGIPSVMPREAVWAMQALAEARTDRNAAIQLNRHKRLASRTPKQKAAQQHNKEQREENEKKASYLKLVNEIIDFLNRLFVFLKRYLDVDDDACAFVDKFISENESLYDELPRLDHEKGSLKRKAFLNNLTNLRDSIERNPEHLSKRYGECLKIVVNLPIENNSIGDINKCLKKLPKSSKSKKTQVIIYAPDVLARGFGAAVFPCQCKKGKHISSNSSCPKNSKKAKAAKAEAIAASAAAAAKAAKAEAEAAEAKKARYKEIISSDIAKVKLANQEEARIEAKKARIEARIDTEKHRKLYSERLRRQGDTFGAKCYDEQCKQIRHNEYATIIQAAARGWLARRHQECLRFLDDIWVEDSEPYKFSPAEAATTIQRAFRGHLARRHQAATAIQRGVRGWLARRRHQAATTIQCAFRRHLARRLARRLVVQAWGDICTGREIKAMDGNPTPSRGFVDAARNWVSRSNSDIPKPKPEKKHKGKEREKRHKAFSELCRCDFSTTGSPDWDSMSPFEEEAARFLLRGDLCKALIYFLVDLKFGYDKIAELNLKGKERNSETKEWWKVNFREIVKRHIYQFFEKCGVEFTVPEGMVLEVTAKNMSTGKFETRKVETPIDMWLGYTNSTEVFTNFLNDILSVYNESYMVVLEAHRWHAGLREWLLGKLATFEKSRAAVDQSLLVPAEPVSEEPVSEEPVSEEPVPTEPVSEEACF